jgi:hypothetical protein
MNLIFASVFELYFMEQNRIVRFIVIFAVLVECTCCLSRSVRL